MNDYTNEDSLFEDKNKNNKLKNKNHRNLIKTAKYFILIITILIVIVGVSFIISTYGGKILRNSKLNNHNTIYKYGFPSNTSYIEKSSYLLSYNNVWKIPNWGYELINKEKLEKNNSTRDDCNFRVDPSISNLFQSNDADYRNSGFDRGHIVPSGNHRDSIEHNCDTFYFSNVSPQYSQFNREIWNSVESYIRKITINANKNTYIATGPIFLTEENRTSYEVIGGSSVAVASHFFKVSLVECSDEKLVTISFMVKNIPEDQDNNLELYLVDLKSVELLTGNIFFPNSNRNNIEESMKIVDNPCQLPT